MDYPLVSVIIPNYNHAKYLDQRIKSVLDQDYPVFEVIILDDCSRDNSRSIIEKYRDNKHVSHIVLNETNSGSTFIQWHKGFSLAKGELIWIAESDDYCERDFLSNLVSDLSGVKNCILCFSSSKYVDADGNYLGTFNPYSGGLRVFDGKEFIKKELTRGCAIWNASAVIFKKDLAISISKEYMDYKMCGDHLFWIKMAECGWIVHDTRILNSFRQHNNKVSPVRILDGTFFREEHRVFDYLKMKGYLSTIQSIITKDYYYNKINNTTFNSAEIKEELVDLWGMKSSKRVLFYHWISLIYAFIDSKKHKK